MDAENQNSMYKIFEAYGESGGVGVVASGLRLFTLSFSNFLSVFSHFIVFFTRNVTRTMRIRKSQTGAD